MSETSWASAPVSLNYKKNVIRLYYAVIGLIRREYVISTCYVTRMSCSESVLNSLKQGPAKILKLSWLMGFFLFYCFSSRKLWIPTLCSSHVLQNFSHAEVHFLKHLVSFVSFGTFWLIYEFTRLWDLWFHTTLVKTRSLGAHRCCATLGFRYEARTNYI